MLSINKALSKFISGDYGLPITFLVLGVLIVTVLGAVTKGITTHGQWCFLLVLPIFTHC
jgi:hypothetical protein